MTTDTYSTIGPECPHCGFQHQASDDPEIYYTEGESEFICSDCGEEFIMQADLDWSWACQPKDE